MYPPQMQWRSQHPKRSRKKLAWNLAKIRSIFPRFRTLCTLLAILLSVMYYKTLSTLPHSNPAAPIPSFVRQTTSGAHPQCALPSGGVAAWDAGTGIIAAILPSTMKSACLSNPAFVRYHMDIYLWVVQAFHVEGTPSCDRAHRWDGDVLNFKEFLVSALIVHDSTTGRPRRLLAYKHHMETLDRMKMKFNGKLFRNETGSIFLAHAALSSDGTSSRQHEKEAMYVSRVDVTKLRADMSQFDIELQPAVLLPLRHKERGLDNSGKGRAEKNWLPWDGSTTMSYTMYPTFHPHGLLRWKNYTHPAPHPRFDMELEIPFFFEFQNRFSGAQFRFSGGTPHVRDGDSWLGVGHIVSPAKLWHEVDPELPVNGSTGRVSYNFRGMNGEGHNENEHFMFFYRYGAHKPHLLTHISNCLKPPVLAPPNGEHASSIHRGFIVPTGLQRIGTDKFLVTYGEDDASLRAAFFTQAKLSELLMPITTIPEVHEALGRFQCCTLPLDSSAST